MIADVFHRFSEQEGRFGRVQSDSIIRLITLG